MSKHMMRRISHRPIASVVVLAASAAITAGVVSSANASPYVPRFQFDCGSAGTFYSEVRSLPTQAAPTVSPPDAAAGLPGFSTARLLTTTSGETNQVYVILAVLGHYATPGLVANQSNPNLVTCILTRPDEQVEVVGLLTGR